MAEGCCCCGCQASSAEEKANNNESNELSEKILRIRIGVAFCLFAIIMLVEHFSGIENVLGASQSKWTLFALYLVPYLIAGYDVLLGAVKNIAKGNVFNEKFLMSIATIGAFAITFFPDAHPSMAEGCAVMVFYQIGEIFEDYAQDKSRKSISNMMDVAPDSVTVEKNGEHISMETSQVGVGSIIIVKPGERVALDGIVTFGTGQLDTSALTGESVPRNVHEGSEVASGCVNVGNVLHIKTTKLQSESTLSRILELVERAQDKKARTENFITRFARYYTPVVTIGAACIAFIPPILGLGSISEWLYRGLTFLVVSCPCALVISVPLTFFCGIGGASKLGVLMKGSNYLEALSRTDTVVFDKTGTLTTGTFSVTSACPASKSTTQNNLLKIAAHAEYFSTHPIAKSIVTAYSGAINQNAVSNLKEVAGHGIVATIGNHEVLVGNATHLKSFGILFQEYKGYETAVYVAQDKEYMGYILLADTIKQDSKEAISNLEQCGVSNTVMLSGDTESVASHVARELGISRYSSQLLPEDKLVELEKIMKQASGNVAFVGDGINDAPSLMRADVGIAMGGIGSDAAIEAADVVLMDDAPSKISLAVKLARHTMQIVWQNIIIALGIKVVILILAAVGLANMWLAVFADVGVCVLAILNATRASRQK